MKITIRSRTKTIKKVIAQINNILSIVDKYKSSYFWSGDNGNCSNRTEFDDLYEFELFGDKVSIELTLSQSRRNTYFHRVVEVNDKKSNMKKLQGYLKKLEDILIKREGK